MNSNQRIGLLSIALSSLLLSACTKETIVEKQAPNNMLESFTSNTTDVCANKSCITIQKSSLGKVFLLISSGKTSGSTPQWYDLKPQVVTFDKSGGRIALLAQNYNSIYKEIQTVNLIQTFEVVSEDTDSITFDWGQGLKTFVQQRSYDTDIPRGNSDDLTESSLPSLVVEDSFVRGIKFDEKNIELEQIIKIRSDLVKSGPDRNTSTVENREETVAMNVQIRAYNLTPDFRPKEYDKSRRVGFFVTKLGKKEHSKDIINLITKWDLSPKKGPIVIRISDAVPAQYLDAVKEGALYWNKVFGRDVISVKTNVDPQAGPEDRSIMVRWIPWEDSGAAYAIGQSDPLTGEVLRAQVFMPSVFTKVGSGDLVHLNNDTPVAPGAVSCDLTQNLAALDAIAKEANDSQRLRLAQDSVRATVAHELGHALGLRHNFAGSFSAKVSTKDIEAAAKNYLQDPNHQGLETSTSIMDYVSGIDDVLMAARIKYAPLSYDKMAMDWAYSADHAALDEKISRYCTDDDIALASSQALQIYGCERFDAGNNPLLRKYLDTKYEKERFIKVLFASIIGRLYPADQPTVVNDIDVVLQDTVKWGKVNLDTLKFINQVLLDKTVNSVPSPQFASIENVKSGQIHYSKVGMDDALGRERTRSLAEAGGYAAVLNDLWRNSDGSIAKDFIERQITELANSPYFAQGKTLGGREYTLTSFQQNRILSFFHQLSLVNKKTLASGLSALLPKVDESETDAKGALTIVSQVLPRNIITAQDADTLAALYLDLTAVENGETTLRVGQGLTKEVKVARSYLTAEERTKWMNLVSSRGLRFEVEMKKALIRSEQYNKVNAVLKEVDPSFDLASIKKPAELPAQLLNQGLVDSAGSLWLTAEINVLLAFDKLR